MAQTKHSIFHYITDVILSMISLTHIANYFKYSRKRKQASNHVGYYWIVSKKATWFKPNSLWLCRLRFLLEFLTEHVPKEPRIRIPFKELNHQGLVTNSKTRWFRNAVRNIAVTMKFLKISRDLLVFSHCYTLPSCGWNQLMEDS